MPQVGEVNQRHSPSEQRRQCFYKKSEFNIIQLTGVGDARCTALRRIRCFSATYEFIWIKPILRRSPWSTHIGYDSMVT
jgi:hypothetical protein